MTDWPAFAGFAGVVLAVLLVLARLSQAAIDREDPASPAERSGPERWRRPGGPAEPVDRRGRPDPGPPVGPTEVDGRATEVDGQGSDANDADDETVAPAGGDRDPDRGGPTAGGGDGPPTGGPSTGVLLANVAISQGALGALLLAGAWYTGVPAAALGAGPSALGAGPLAAGVALGTALYAANEAGAAVGRRAGFGGGEELRRALAPASTAGWAVLLLVVLPVIAGFEELLFRGVLVGALHAGFGVSPWLLAVLSSVAFAAGHGAQGRVGVIVTGTLGFVLAAAFVVTGSLLAVVVAHYLVNAAEFLVHEWAGVTPADEWGPG